MQVPHLAHGKTQNGEVGQDVGVLHSCHISGFVLHASELSPADISYVSNGWKAMRILSGIGARGSFTKPYMNAAGR